MKKTIKFISAFLILSVLISLCTVSGKAATQLTATKAEEYNELFDRTSKSSPTWLGADGIYTANLNGDDSFGSADGSTKTVFFFSDTLMGASDSDGKVVHSWAMPSHTSAVLTGDEPDKDNMRFVYGTGGNMSFHHHIFGERRWLYDCVVLNEKLYVFGFSPSNDWKPENTDMWEIPIKNGEPNYNEYKKTANIKELIYRTSDDRYLYSYGMGISVDDDGYVYIYGYRDAMKEWSRKDLIVSRIKKSDFPDFSKLSYWNGSGWGSDITASQPVLQSVSCEMSVTKVPSGPYKGKYIAVYTKDTQSENMAYAIGDSPVGPFNEPVIFYKAPENNKTSASGEGRLYTYNAKAHPHLSKDGKLLVSYNCNVADAKEQYSVDYHPRFLWLDLDPNNEGDAIVESTEQSQEESLIPSVEQQSQAASEEEADVTTQYAQSVNTESSDDDEGGGISPVAVALPITAAVLCSGLAVIMAIKRKKK